MLIVYNTPGDPFVNLILPDKMEPGAVEFIQQNLTFDYADINPIMRYRYLFDFKGLNDSNVYSDKGYLTTCYYSRHNRRTPTEILIRAKSRVRSHEVCMYAWDRFIAAIPLNRNNYGADSGYMSPRFEEWLRTARLYTWLEGEVTTWMEKRRR